MRSPATEPTTSKRAAPGDPRPTTDHSTSDPAASADLDGGQAIPDAHAAGASVDLDRGQVHADALVPRAPVDLSPAVDGAAPRMAPPGDLDGSQRCVGDLGRDASVDLDGDQTCIEAHTWGVPASSNGTDQSQRDVQAFPVGAESSPGHRTGDAQSRAVGVSSNGHHASEALKEAAVGSDGNGHVGHDIHVAIADPSDALLVILADQLDDIEKARIAAENRLRSLAQVKGLAGSKAEATLQLLTEDWQTAEKRITLELKRAMRTHRFGPWVKQNVGLGEKQAARLIAAIGDPLWNGAEDRPRRGPAELWAYCGYRPDQGKRKGQLHAYNWEAKMRAFLCAESCIKQTGKGGAVPDSKSIHHARRPSPFRAVYDRERLKWADRDVADAHKHAHALRVTAKEILKDLWRYAAEHPTEPRRATPAAADQLRTANRDANSKGAAPSDLQAADDQPTTTPAALPEPVIGPAPAYTGRGHDQRG